MQVHQVARPLGCGDDIRIVQALALPAVTEADLADLALLRQVAAIRIAVLQQASKQAGRYSQFYPIQAKGASWCFIPSLSYLIES